MPTSLYSLLVFSHSVLGYELNWAKEADEFKRAAEEAARQARDIDALEGFKGL